MANLTVLIPTYNEEENIKDCLESVKWADNILVVDSFSNDSTLDIVKHYDVKILQHEYINSASQKNWALNQISTEWVLIVDSDERVTEELKGEIQSIINNKGEHTGYYIPRKNYFLSKWMKYSDWYPDYNMRLFKLREGRYEERAVHAHVKLEGTVGYLQGHLVHYSINTISQYIKKMDRYSSWEATERIKKKEGKVDFNWKQSSNRMRAKFLWHFLPLKPFLRFFWSYILRKGFLDGYHGFILGVFNIFYEYLVAFKVKEMEKKLKHEIKPEFVKGSSF